MVSFIVGLLIGGLLVWAFSGPSTDAPTTKKENNSKEKVEEKNSETEEENEESSDVNEDRETSAPAPVVTAPVPTLAVGDGKVVVNNQAASSNIKLDSATYPVKEGWIGVRDYQGGQLGSILGVVRFSEEQGLVPSEIVLQRSTVAGREYAVMIWEESGDRAFNSADDKQLDTVFATFTAQ